MTQPSRNSGLPHALLPAEIAKSGAESGTIIRVDALGIIDGAGLAASPASLLLQLRSGRELGRARLRVLALGSPPDVDQHEAANSPRLVRIRRPRSILIPGLINAHTHLDLTHIGPQPFDPTSGFAGWVDMIRTRRHTQPTDIASSVGEGARLSLVGGVVAVGDIGGAVAGRACLSAFQALTETAVQGVSFLEFFAMGNRQAQGLEGLSQALGDLDARQQGSAVRLGLQPHAPYSVSKSAYAAAARTAQSRGMLISTHLSETPEESELIAHANGPLRALLEAVGAWSASLKSELGQGHSPICHLGPSDLQAIDLAAHVNNCSDADMELLAKAGVTVVYCPRASTYFGRDRDFGPHRYRDMQRSGIRVILGTDSIVNLPQTACTHGISTLDEMRLLFERDGTSPQILLKMATIDAAAALRLPPGAFCFDVGHEVAGVVSVEVTTDGVSGLPTNTIGRTLLSGERRASELLFGNTDYE